MITVINLKISNIASVVRALKRLKVECNVCDNPDGIMSASKIILPGVGSFAEGAMRLKNSGIGTALRKKVIEENTPILGICLGMQLLASSGEEGGISEGLGFIKAKVSLHRAGQKGLELPHIGWNDVRVDDFRLFDSIPNNSCFYFVHSYEMIPQEPVVCAWTNYGVDFVAAVKKDNIMGTQFHPEKSQEFGLKLLKNFCEDKF